MRLLVATSLLLFSMSLAIGQDQDHGDHQAHGDHAAHGDHGAMERHIEPPTVFLDKSPRIVEYQLKRLDNQRLLMVERETSDPKFIPVYEAILTRVGMSPQFQQEAVAALAELKEASRVEVMIETIADMDADEGAEKRVAQQLARMLLKEPTQEVAAASDSLKTMLSSDQQTLSSIAAAALVVSGNDDMIRSAMQDDEAVTRSFLASFPLIPDMQQRNSLRAVVIEILESDSSAATQRAAITALGFITKDSADSFQRIARFAMQDAFRQAAIRTLLRIDPKQRDTETSIELAESLVVYAENTPAEDRTSDPFVDAMQLADQLLAKIPSDVARSLRSRLSEVTVRLVRIKTVEEEMRYDVAYFAVQAGKPVQIVLENHDLMPHNLVVTTPGTLKEVAQEGLQAGPDGGLDGLAYVPNSPNVLHATPAVNTDKLFRLTFTAPTEPGEYPYVCTFPQHWYRMYGVMVVVEDLDAFLKNPVEPANPIGSNRSFVQAWTVDDLKEDLDSGMRGRSAEIGKKIFEEASCLGCHKMKGEGGIIGPELTDVMTRWKGDRVAVLREILDPSHKVDAKYAMQRLLTIDGLTITGVLLKEDDDSVTLITNPEAKEPTVIPQDEIEVMVPSSVSMMPKALMDQYTKDEIFELMNYLEAVDETKP